MKYVKQGNGEPKLGCRHQNWSELLPRIEHVDILGTESRISLRQGNISDQITGITPDTGQEVEETISSWVSRLGLFLCKKIGSGLIMELNY